MIVFALTTLLLAPWKGADLPTATATASKYQLTIKGAPGSEVNLHASHVENGWIAAFCDNRVCSPNKVREALPASGSMMLQFELIREDDKAAKSTGATIESDDGAAVSVKTR